MLFLSEAHHGSMLRIESLPPIEETVAPLKFVNECYESKTKPQRTVVEEMFGIGSHLYPLN